MQNPNVIRNKYHGCITQQVLTGDGWDVSLLRELPNGGEELIQKCKDLAEAIAAAKQHGTVLPPVQHPQTGVSPASPAAASVEAEPGVTVEVEIEK